MVSINYAAREVCCKIVYYGPGLSGKTTNLQYVHAKVPGNSRGKLISLATESDRTLYFDFLPINIGTINGFQAKFQLYTVPGQVYYNATRKLVLRGVDGVVFVADSQPDKMDENFESLSNLVENLKEYGYDPDNLPIVIQYNKRDLPGILSEEELNARLNPRGWPHFGASATVGNGVFDTLKMIIKLVLDRAKSSQTSAVQPTQEASEASSSPAPAPRRMAGMPATPGPSAAQAVSAQAVGVAPPEPQVSRSAPERVAAMAPSMATPPVQPVSESHASPVAIAEPPAPAVEPDDPPAYRPFPGSRNASPGSGHEPVDAGDHAMHQASKPMDNITPNPSPSVPSAGMSGPQMAPPLKRREPKKRGFFKRLFGIR